jgi:hypothetical protein
VGQHFTCCNVIFLPCRFELHSARGYRLEVIATRLVGLGTGWAASAMPFYSTRKLVGAPMIATEGQRVPEIIAGGLLVLMAMLGALIDSISPF